MRSLRAGRALVQAGAVLLTALLATNAAYLVRLADQAGRPGPILSALAATGVFPFGPEAGVLSIEDYCPFGPLEGIAHLCRMILLGYGPSFAGPVTLRNLGVLLAVLVLALLTKKSFCSWLCPFGAVFEAAGALGRRLGLPRVRLPRRLDSQLRGLRYAVLLVLIGSTGWAGSLVFKEVDPFYALYSLGADVVPWAAYAVLGLLLAAALVLPEVWCHYLCPMGGALDPLSRLGRIRVVRSSDACTHCGGCAAACPQRIQVPGRKRVTDGLCTNCLSCLDACPEPGALELRLELWP